jgi:AraC-like DNA-binding protein
MQIDINDYYEPEHFRAICEDNYNISRTCEFEKNEMHHIHNTCELLFIEEGSADYYISGKKYHIEPHDILVIGPMEHHFRRIDKLPFLRYGLTIRPTYYRSIILDDDLLKVFVTPTPENFNLYYKNIDPDIFNRILDMLCFLKDEEAIHKPFRSQIQRNVISLIAVVLFRAFNFKKKDSNITASNARMLEIKEYIDTHFTEELDLNSLSEKFFLHPSTISKDFNKYCGYNLNKYINIVRVCEAAKLLESNSDSVADISEQCGYSNMNTFLRQFKLIMEISPLQYRKSVHDLWQKKSK